jgi:hypothetical protein
MSEKDDLKAAAAKKALNDQHEREIKLLRERSVVEKGHASDLKRNRKLVEEKIATDKKLIRTTKDVEKANAAVAKGEDKFYKASERVTTENKDSNRSFSALKKGIEAVPKALNVANSAYKAYVKFSYETIRASNKVHETFGKITSSVGDAKTQISNLAAKYKVLSQQAKDIGNDFLVPWQDVIEVQDSLISKLNLNIKQFDEASMKGFKDMQEHVININRTTGMGVQEQIDNMRHGLESGGAVMKDFQQDMESVANAADHIQDEFKDLTDAQRQYKMFVRSELLGTITQMRTQMEDVIITQKTLAATYTEVQKKAMKFGMTAREGDKASQKISKGIVGNNARALTPVNFLGGRDIMKTMSKFGKDDKAAKAEIVKQLEGTGIDPKIAASRADQAFDLYKQGDFLGFYEIMRSTDMGMQSKFNVMAHGPIGNALNMKGQYGSVIKHAVIGGYTAGEDTPDNLMEANLMSEVYRSKKPGEAVTPEDIKAARAKMTGFDDKQKEGIKEVEQKRKAVDKYDILMNNAIGPQGAFLKDTATATQGMWDIMKDMKGTGAGFLGIGGAAVNGVKAAGAGLSSAVAGSGGAAGAAAVIAPIAAIVLASIMAGAAGKAAIDAAFDQAKAHQKATEENFGKGDALTKKILENPNDMEAVQQAKDLAAKQAMESRQGLSQRGLDDEYANAQRLMDSGHTMEGLSQKVSTSFKGASTWLTASSAADKNEQDRLAQSAEQMKKLAEQAEKKKADADREKDIENMMKADGAPFGSHAAGNFKVPYANYMAQLHRGEEVVSQADSSLLVDKMSDTLEVIKSLGKQASPSEFIANHPTQSLSSRLKSSVIGGYSSDGDPSSSASVMTGGKLTAEARMTNDGKFIITINQFEDVVMTAIDRSKRASITSI